MINLKIHELCKNIRIEKNLTQEDVAINADVTRQTVINFENGKADSFRLLIYFLSLDPDLGHKLINKYKNTSGEGVIEVIIIMFIVCLITFFIISMGR